MSVKHTISKSSIIIPEHELIITTSRGGGPGGQHVNKADTRVTLRWNVPASNAFDEQGKQMLLAKLSSQLTGEGDLIIHSHATRSQLKNKQLAYEQLTQTIRKALYVPKKRTKTAPSQAIHEQRLQRKKKQSELKKLRSKYHY